jgi:capsid assembly protease
MNMIELLSSPWAIQPGHLLELQSLYAKHLHGDRIDLAAVEQRLGRPLANEQKAYTVQDGTGVAVLEIAGIIAPKANMLTKISGGAVASLLQKQVLAMAGDPSVKAVVLDLDSPGGSVQGIPALCNAVRLLADRKPTVAVSSGTMASAAYWVGCAANAVYAGGETDFIGSIGVVATHSYTPSSTGVKTTEVTAGKYKRLASEAAPLTQAGHDYLQGQVDEIYRVFVDAVAFHRGAAVDAVLKHMADGRVFIGKSAVKAGLVDGIASVGHMVQRLAENPQAFAQRRRAVVKG